MARPPPPDPAILEEKIEFQHNEILMLLDDNRRLADDRAALQRELDVARHEIFYLNHLVSDIHANQEIRHGALIERNLMLEANLRSSETFKKDAVHMRSEVQKLEKIRQELVGQVQSLSKTLAKLKADNQQIPHMKAEIEGLQQELMSARKAIDYEKKTKMGIMEQKQAMENKLISMAREVEKLRAELSSGHARPWDGAYEHRWYFPDTEEDGFNTIEKPPKPHGDDYPDFDENAVVAVGDDFDLQSLLFTPDRDYLIRNNGQKVNAADLSGKYIAVFGVCIPVLKHDPVAIDCQTVIATHEELSKTKGDFEVVLVVRIRPEFASDDADNPLAYAAFQHFFSAFPCLAIPFTDTVSRRKFYPPMGLSNYYIPSVFIADKQGKLLLNNASLFRSFGSNLYPFTAERVQQLHDECSQKYLGKPLEDLLDLPSSHVLQCPCGHGCNRQASVSDLKQKLMLLYVCMDGRYMKRIYEGLDQARQQHDFDVVITCQPFSVRGRPLSEQRLRDLLQSNKVCGWLELPFRDKVCRLLWRSFCYSTEMEEDTLVAFGPSSSFVYPLARQILSNYGSVCGPDLYPFTREAAINATLKKLSTFTMPQLLESAGIHHLDRKAMGDTVPNSYLKGRDVLLYFGYATAAMKSRLHCPWEERLIKWFSEIKGSNSTFELVFLCLGVEDGATFDGYCSCMPWLTVPYKKEIAAETAGSVLKPLSFIHTFRSNSSSILIAFGSSGRLRELQAQHHFDSSCNPITFPPEENLVNEVTRLVDCQISDDPF